MPTPSPYPAPLWSRPWDSTSLRPLCYCGCGEPVKRTKDKFVDWGHCGRLWSYVRQVLGGYRIAETCIPPWAVEYVNWTLYQSGSKRRVTRVDAPRILEMEFRRRLLKLRRHQKKLRKLALRNKRRALFLDRIGPYIEARRRRMVVVREIRAMSPRLVGWSMKRMVRGY